MDCYYCGWKPIQLTWHRIRKIFEAVKERTAIGMNLGIKCFELGLI